MRVKRSSRWDFHVLVEYPTVCWGACRRLLARGSRRRCFLCSSAAVLFLDGSLRPGNDKSRFFIVFACSTAMICIVLTRRTLCSGYSRAEELCKEYRQTKGPGTTAKPSEQQFFLKLGSLIKNTLDKCQRENGFMWVRRALRTFVKTANI